MQTLSLTSGERIVEDGEEGAEGGGRERETRGGGTQRMYIETENVPKQSDTYVQTHARIATQAHALTHTHTHTHSHSRTHAHTHTHTR